MYYNKSVCVVCTIRVYHDPPMPKIECINNLVRLCNTQLNCFTNKYFTVDTKIFYGKMIIVILILNVAITTSRHSCTTRLWDT